MHPSDYHPSHRLSDWPDCVLEVRCPCSGRVTLLPTRFLIERRGDQTIRAVLTALRCSACKGKPAPVFLVAGPCRTSNFGPPPAWALELVLDLPE